MRLDQKDYQIAANISNSYESLIPIGTLLYYGVPTEDVAFQGIPVKRSSWCSFDAEFIHSEYGSRLHESMKALVFLVRHRYFSATFKAFQYMRKSTAGPQKITVWKVRVYAVPLDVHGSRHLRLWRRRWLTKFSTLHKQKKTYWQVLICFIDFSPSKWSAVVGHDNKRNVARGIGIPFLSASKDMHKRSDSLTNYHIHRWANQECFVESPQLHETLESIVRSLYSEIQSPDLSRFVKMTINNILSVPSAEETISVLLTKDQLKAAYIPGLSSTLYSFQLRSVCKMYEKETTNTRQCVPHLVKFNSPIGSTYYYNTLEDKFNLMPELYYLPKGGILAENMGLGKTLICLALVCLTKHEMSTIPDDILLGMGDESDYQRSSDGKSMKSLAEISLTSVAQSSLPWKCFVQDLPLNIVQKLMSLPGEFFVSQESAQSHLGLRSRHSQLNTTIKKLILTSSTLVIVPENLLHQWNDEAKKHVDTSFLRKLFISDRFRTPMYYKNVDYLRNPPHDPVVLAMYDLIVISAILFSKLSSDLESVFMKIYWKRLIIDEGHSMSSRSSNLSLACKLVFAERRWVASGTPTSGLTDLHIDEVTPISTSESPKKKKRKYSVRGKFNVREDLRKIGNLVSNFFKIEPFCSQPGLWNMSITKNLTNSNQFTTKLSLQNLLDSLVVRHKQPQVEEDLVLPQLHHKTIFLDPSYQNKLAINLFTSVLAVNAVSSERTGKDYMFDSSNRQQLRKLVSNLQLSTFYWTGFQVLDVTSLIHVAKTCLEKKKLNGEPYYEFEDCTLLKSSLNAVELALRNPRWRAAALLHEMQIYVTGLPPQYIANFAMESVKEIGVYGSPQLQAVQKFFYKNRFLPIANEEALGTRLRETSKVFWEDYWLRSRKNKELLLKSEAFLKNGARNNINVSHKESRSTSTESNPNHSHSKKVSVCKFGNMSIDENSSYCLDPKKARVIGTASTKLSYLATKLVSHQKHGIKSIVFFEFEENAYYLTELLDVLGINYILYATFIGSERRPNNLNEFALHDTRNKGGITLIMDLKLASHGLTVISATRVYFISPVWQKSIEAQAIKRAHRIGQPEEVYVETLVLRGTLEEEIHRRRTSSDDDEQALGTREENPPDNKYVIDDTEMQTFVMKHAFLPVDTTEQEYASFFEELGANTASDNHQLPSPDKSLEPEFALSSHSSNVITSKGQTRRVWKLHLFSESNLQKLEESNQSKADLKQLNVEYVEGRRESISTQTTAVSKSKRVRF